MRTAGYSDTSIILTTFFLKSIGLWTAEDRAQKRRMQILFVYSIFNSAFGLIVATRDLYFTWLTKGDTLYAVTNILTVLMALLKICIILLHKTKFMDLLEYLGQHFLNAKYDYYEKQIFDKCKASCIVLISGVTTIGILSMISYVASPIVASNGNNESDRLLPFNIWIDLPLSNTPYYEILFTIQTISMYFVATCYFCFDNALCIMSVHVAGQFRILQYRLTNLFDSNPHQCEKNAYFSSAEYADKSYEKLKDCIQQHQALIEYCEQLENVYTMITLGQVLIFSVLICLFGYQVLLAECSFARRIIFVWLITGSMALLFMFTYSCDVVIEQSENVTLGAYSARWTVMPMNKSGRMLRNDLITVVARSRRVCCLTAYGFFPVSLETYTKILSTAASYFTLLRNHLEES